MNKRPNGLLKCPCTLALLAGWLWLCFAFPEELTSAFETVGIIPTALGKTAP